MSGLIATSKIADCDRCFAKSTQCRKRGKQHLCLHCCRQDDVANQLRKKREKVQVRSLNNFQKSIGVDNKNDLNRWFEGIARKHGKYGAGCACMECGAWIPHKYLRHATAHLLPKKLFFSVATHELNYLIL